MDAASISFLLFAAAKRSEVSREFRRRVMLVSQVQTDSGTYSKVSVMTHLHYIRCGPISEFYLSVTTVNCEVSAIAVRKKAHPSPWVSRNSWLGVEVFRSRP